METTEIVISKANSIRFAERNDLMPSFDNKLVNEESWDYIPVQNYKQIIVNGTTKLIQVKAGLTAVVTLVSIDENGTETAYISVNTVYTDFIVYDYLISFPKDECFYFEVRESGVAKHISEIQEVIASADGYLKIEWANLDLVNNSFEFDYQTVTAKAYVNHMYVKGRLLTYEPKGEETIYNNQDKVELLKANYFRVLGLELEVLPRQISEIIGIATRHDMFNVNEVAFTAEELPSFDMFGSSIQFKAALTQNLALGINTHDIGFDCDSISGNMRVDPLGVEDAVSDGQLSVQAGFAITNIILMPYAGTTPTIKIGSTVGGDDILKTFTVPNTAPLTPKTMTREFAPTTDANWTIYYEVLSGQLDIYITTVMFNLQP